MKTLIVVPARYASKRFPGKPLAEVAGVSMVARTGQSARAAAAELESADFVVATDDPRIRDHCEAEGLPVVMTDPALPSGSDRALAAAEAMGAAPDIIVNLQGDAPLTPPDYITAIVRHLEASDADAATPCVQLDWDALDALRAAKQSSPFSGTTCLVDGSGKALWFSKTVLPAMRHEESLRTQNRLSPVRQHIGLYAFKTESLRRFTALPVSAYEALEGLEQLRLLENGMSIICVDVPPTPFHSSGVDTPEDLKRLCAQIEAQGRVI